jgi:hypothetical protein
MAPPIADIDYAIQLQSSLLPNTVQTISEKFTMMDFSCDSTNQGVGCPDERRISVTFPKAESEIVRGRSYMVQWRMDGKNQDDEWTEQSVV